MTVSQTRFLALVACALSPLSCGPESAAPPLVGIDIQAQRFDGSSEWSVPVNVGAPVNSADNEANAAMSSDELSLYITSNRAGGLGGTDIWVSQRDCGDCAWGAPVNLGAPINGAGTEAGPRLSIDGHLLFFQSDRPGGQGTIDIYVSRRKNPKDDFSWGDPVNLGPDVNTPLLEQAASYLQSAEDGAGNLYFNRGPVGLADLYYAAVTRDGETRGPAVLVSELSDPAAFDQHATVRKDGREIFLASTRVGGLGGFDLYTSTRRSVHEPWSPPVNLGAPLNTTVNDQQPSLSSDARTLLFTSNRPNGFGGNDLWISTRTPSGH
ncbi:MAG: PD40 domain-containing protein [Cytophagales bacterium]|nr:PD40 domain-containing protein [Armatimonadota bacterium]